MNYRNCPIGKKVDHSILVISRHIDYWFTEVHSRYIKKKNVSVIFFLRSKMYPTIILFWHYNTHLVRKRIASTVKASAPRNGPPKLLHKRSKRRPMRKSFSSSPSVIMYYYSSTLCESLWTRQLLLTIVYYYVYSSSFTKKNTKQSKLLVVFQTCGRFWLDIPPKYTTT